jgi:hypothetical protein
MATEGKSKRDLIWEQKRKAREDRLRGGINNLHNLILVNNQDVQIFSDEPKVDFSKKSPLFGDNLLNQNVNQEQDM